MSSVTDLLTLAQYDQAARQAQNPLYALFGGIGSGIQQGVIDEYEKKRQMERTKTEYSKLQQLLGGESQDYQNHYKIKPTWDSKSGEVGATLTEKSDADRFSQAVQSGLGPNQLRMQFPQYADKIDQLEISGIFGRGTPVQAAPQAVINQSAQPGVIRPALPQPILGQNATNDIVPKGWDALGRPTGYERNPAIEKQAEADIKSMGEKKVAEQMANQSLGMVTGSLQELAKTYADAVKEGGIGGRLAKTKSDAALWAGGSVGENFPATSAFPGQKTEVIARMMPILTQQGDKPGSVRLVQTVFDKLEKTLPDETTPPKNARRMMEQTIRNMFRFARASQIMSSEMGVTDDNFNQLAPQQQKALSGQLEQVAARVNLSPAEEQTINGIVNEALKPLDSLTGQQTGNQIPEVGGMFNGEKVLNVKRIR